jgi:transposase
MDITNREWAAIAPLFPIHPWKKVGHGRPRCPDRDVLNGILWVLRTGAQWKEMPERYPSYQTCHRRFQEWVKIRLFQKVLRALAKELVAEGKLTLDEWFMDGTFASAKKGGPA